jgi:hypothetical protein
MSKKPSEAYIPVNLFETGIKKAWRVMGGIDPDACDRIFTFGQEGKPHYFRGPRDSSAFSNRVMNTLTKRLGPGNFNFTVIEGDGFGDFFDEED